MALSMPSPARVIGFDQNKVFTYLYLGNPWFWRHCRRWVRVNDQSQNNIPISHPRSLKFCTPLYKIPSNIVSNHHLLFGKTPWIQPTPSMHPKLTTFKIPFDQDLKLWFPIPPGLCPSVHHSLKIVWQQLPMRQWKPLTSSSSKK